MTALLPGPAEAAVFATAVLVLNATPGVDLLLTIGRTLQGGPRAGVAAALGIGAGCAVHALAAAAGLAALLALHPQALTLLQWVGAAYLAWLGVGQLRTAAQARPAAVESATDSSTGPPTPAQTAAPSLAAEFRRGLLTNVLNPKVALFFLAFLPPFVPAGSPAPTVSMLLLGAWFVAQGTVFLLGVVALASRLRLAQALQAASGTLFLALAWRLVRAKPLAG